MGGGSPYPSRHESVHLSDFLLLLVMRWPCQLLQHAAFRVIFGRRHLQPLGSSSHFTQLRWLPLSQEHKGQRRVRLLRLRGSVKAQ